MSGVVPGTALPWRADGPNVFAGDTCQATLIANTNQFSDHFASTAGTNAAYIVHACNTLPALQAHADALVLELEGMLGGKCPECKGWGEVAYFGEMVSCKCRSRYRHDPSDERRASARQALTAYREREV